MSLVTEGPIVVTLWHAPHRNPSAPTGTSSQTSGALRVKLPMCYIIPPPSLFPTRAPSPPLRPISLAAISRVPVSAPLRVSPSPSCRPPQAAN